MGAHPAFSIEAMAVLSAQFAGYHGQKSKLYFKWYSSSDPDLPSLRFAHAKDSLSCALRCYLGSFGKDDGEIMELAPGTLLPLLPSGSPELRQPWRTNGLVPELPMHL